MKKIFSSEKSPLIKLNTLSDLLVQFEIFDGAKMSLAQALINNVDIIELLPNEFRKLQLDGLLPSVDFKASRIGLGDTLIKVATDRYKVVTALADCVLFILKKKQLPFEKHSSVMIVGSYDFVLSMSAKMALSGYSKMILSIDQYDKTEELKKVLTEFVFNLDLQFVRLSELTLIQKTSSILISNVCEQMSTEAFESLMYFNFASTGAIFFDFCSEENKSLVDEARRAGLQVVEEIEILRAKYQSFLDI